MKIPKIIECPLKLYFIFHYLPKLNNLLRGLQIFQGIVLLESILVVIGAKCLLFSNPVTFNK